MSNLAYKIYLSGFLLNLKKNQAALKLSTDMKFVCLDANCPIFKISQSSYMFQFLAMLKHRQTKCEM